MNGFLILDKPGGLTSHDVVSRVRRITGEQQVGHLGTLDPLATGVLPLLLGKWTRLAQFFGKLTKSYTGTIRFGFATDTYDAEGEPVGERVQVSLDPAALSGLAQQFVGTTMQMPPAYSAKKVGGKSAHQLARAGKTVALKPVAVQVEHFTITRASSECAEFAVTVSAGGYVRSLAHDLGIRMGCGAHLSSLRRVAAGPFTLDAAMTLEELDQTAREGKLSSRMPHPRQLLPELPATTADPLAAARFRTGNLVNLPVFTDVELVKVFEGRDLLLGVARRVAGTLFQPTVVLG